MVTDTIGGKHQHLNGWKSVSLLGETANASIVKREDATGGNFLRLKHDDSSVLGGAGISTGLKIGTNPIVASFEVYLSGAENGGRQRLRVGFMSTKEPETTQSSVIDFSRNDDGSWGLNEVGSYKSNRALSANLVDDMGKKYVIPAEKASKWHKVQVVYIPASGANAAKVTYCVDGEKLSTSNPNTDYVHPADGSLGAFVYVSQNGTHPDSYFGLDNVKVFEYPKEKVKAEYSTVNAGTKQVKYSWCVPVTEIPQNSDISIVKFANAKDMLENNNGTPISVTDIACDTGGMIIDFSEELKGFEQYRITVSEKKNILGNPLGHIFETSVIPVSSSADIETTKAAEYSFDSIDLDMYSNNPGACTVEEFDGDNRLKINADGAVTFSYLNVDIPLDDTGIEYADISFDTKTVWRAAANLELDRFEFGIAQRNGSSSYPRAVLARFFPEIVQASISAVPGDGLGTTPVFVDSVAKSLYKKDDWNSFKIRYYPKNPSDSTIGQYQLYIKNDDGEYVEMLQAAQPAAKPVDGVLAAMMIRDVPYSGYSYGLDNSKLYATKMPKGDAGRFTQMGGNLWMFSKNSTPEQIEAGFKWLEFTGFAPEMTAEQEQKFREDCQNTITNNGVIVERDSFDVWTNPETLEKRRAIRKEYANVDYNDYKNYFEATDVEVKLEPAACAQQLYAVIDGCIQEVITNENADVDKLISDACKDFQQNHLDKM